MVFSIIALVITAANLWWHGSLSPDASVNMSVLAIINQLVAAAFGIIGFIRYRGRRWRPNYEIGKPPIWTLARAFTVIAMVASLGAILLPAAGLLGW